ncbi:hypothetical protein ACFRCG_39920 [Embleya sp. NPDC056575]|uniref:hypothetical protein n=1 Tax=unclassified Embleya TaxID=2699296 RepID=UPI003692CAA5
MPQQFIRNPALFLELARSDDVRDALKDKADTGHTRLLATAPTYTGPTFSPAHVRAGEYAAMSFSHTVMGATGWRAQYGSDAPWTLQVEYGTGKIKRTRRRVVTETIDLSKRPRLDMRKRHRVDLSKRSRVNLTKGISLTKSRGGRGGSGGGPGGPGGGGGGGGGGGPRRIVTYITTSRRTRTPQGGYNLKTRVLYKSLMSMRVRTR